MLSEREKMILTAIEDYIKENGFSPTVREIAEIIGLKSPSTVHRYLKILETKGYITRLGNSPRALKIIKN